MSNATATKREVDGFGRPIYTEEEQAKIDVAFRQYLKNFDARVVYSYHDIGRKLFGNTMETV